MAEIAQSIARRIKIFFHLHGDVLGLQNRGFEPCLAGAKYACVGTSFTMLVVK